MVFQSSALFDSLTVMENIAFGLIERVKLSEVKLRKIVAEKLEMVGLEGTEDLMPSQLSGGMRKRISLARTLVVDPMIMLYDEPTTGLDPITSTEISELILEVQEKYKTSSIIITHDI